MKVVVLLALQLCLAYCETCPDNKPRSLMQLRSVVAPVEEDIESLTMDQLSDKIMKLEGSLTAIPNMPGLEAARAHISHSIEQCKVVLAKKQEEEKKRKAEEEEMMKKLSISEIEEQIKTLEESLAALPADNAALAGERKKISDKLETMQTLLVKKKKDEELKTKTSAEVAEEIKTLEGSLSALPAGVAALAGARKQISDQIEELRKIFKQKQKEELQSLTSDQLSDKIKKLETSLDALGTLPAMEAARAHIASEIEELQDLFKEKLQEELKDLTSVQIQAKIDVMKESLKGLPTGMASIEHVREGLKDQIATLESALPDKIWHEKHDHLMKSSGMYIEGVHSLPLDMPPANMLYEEWPDFIYPYKNRFFDGVYEQFPVSQVEAHGLDLKKQLDTAYAEALASLSATHKEVGSALSDVLDGTTLKAVVSEVDGLKSN